MELSKLPARMQRKIRVEDRGFTSPCWIWLGSNDGHFGHGRVHWRERKMIGAHRAAYILLRGEIPQGLQIDHLCRQPPCCNPEHLEPVTNRENQMRAPAGPIIDNLRKTSCINGHPYDSANTYRRPGGARDCRVCIRARVHAYLKRKKAA